MRKIHFPWWRLEVITLIKIGGWRFGIGLRKSRKGSIQFMETYFCIEALRIGHCLYSLPITLGSWCFTIRFGNEERNNEWMLKLSQEDITEENDKVGEYWKGVREDVKKKRERQKDGSNDDQEENES